MKPRDDIADIRLRLTECWKRTIRIRWAIGQWKPNDRPLKVVKAHIANAEDYLIKIEEELQQCTPSNPKST